MTERNHETNVCDYYLYEHREVDCKQEKNLCLISSSTSNRSFDPRDDKMWIGDSGATVRITNDDAEMFNIKKCDYDITVGNQETTKCTKMGDINLKLKNSAGIAIMVTLSNVRYGPSFIGNLFSIPTAMSNGAEIRFVNNKMEVKKNNDMFEFLP